MPIAGIVAGCDNWPDIIAILFLLVCAFLYGKYDERRCRAKREILDKLEGK